MIQITENAAKHIQKMLVKRDLGEMGLRVGVKAGGCSGFEYVFGWEQSPKVTDIVFEGPEGAKVFVDPKSLRLLDGTVLDYDTALLSKGFMFNNPNAKSTCGCGVSFSVDAGGQRGDHT
jgi:iron-sulfur cluster assembly protein